MIKILRCFLYFNNVFKDAPSIFSKIELKVEYLFEQKLFKTFADFISVLTCLSSSARFVLIVYYKGFSSH